MPRRHSSVDERVAVLKLCGASQASSCADLGDADDTDASCRAGLSRYRAALDAVSIHELFRSDSEFDRALSWPRSRRTRPPKLVQRWDMLCTALEGRRRSGWRSIHQRRPESVDERDRRSLVMRSRRHEELMQLGFRAAARRACASASRSATTASARPASQRCVDLVAAACSTAVVLPVCRRPVQACLDQLATCVLCGAFSGTG